MTKPISLPSQPQPNFDEYECQMEKRGICPWICCSEIMEYYADLMYENEDE